jgi:hypothetical protein
MNKDIVVVWVSVSTLKPNPKNNNKHTDEQIKRLARILAYQGFRSPIVVSNQSGFITKGHCTLAAAKLNGWDKVPVSYQDYENEEMEFSHLTSDNSIALWSTIDMDSVYAEVARLDIPDVDVLGFENYGLKDTEGPEEITLDEDSKQISVNVSFLSELDAEEFYNEMQTRGLQCKLIV